MKKPDLVALISVWEFITAFFALVGIAALALVALAPASWWYPDTPYLDGTHVWIVFGVSIGALVLLAYAILAVAAAVGLLKGKKYGRILSIVHGALSLPGFPVGTVIGILQIAYLTKTEVKEYFENVL